MERRPARHTQAFGPPPQMDRRAICQCRELALPEPGTNAITEGAGRGIEPAGLACINPLLEVGRQNCNGQPGLGMPISSRRFLKQEGRLVAASGRFEKKNLPAEITILLTSHSCIQNQIKNPCLATILRCRVTSGVHK
jgi:hypothetical protein